MWVETNHVCPACVGFHRPGMGDSRYHFATGANGGSHRVIEACETDLLRFCAGHTDGNVMVRSAPSKKCFPGLYTDPNGKIERLKPPQKAELMKALGMSYS